MDDITSKTIGILIEAETLAATATGAAVPTAGLTGQIGVIARVGTPGSSTGTLSLQVQTSANGTSGWVNAGGAMAFATAGGLLTANIGAEASLGFLQCVATVGGTAPSFPLTVLYIASAQYK
jgi:hypothetical protein